MPASLQFLYGAPVPGLETLQLNISAQPDDTTCGPTCLQAVYRYFGDSIPLDQVIAEVPPLQGGGTLAVLLANHALGRGYRATIYTYNVELFDPSWFHEGKAIDNLAHKLSAQAQVKSDAKLQLGTLPYLKFVALGGRLRFRDLTAELLRSYLKKGRPILTGLSSTYLYGCQRDRNNQDDDIGGEPAGHFVLLAGYNPEHRTISIEDPLTDNSFRTQKYEVSIDRLIGAIFLGILTNDANLLIVEPKP